MFENPYYNWMVWAAAAQNLTMLDTIVFQINAKAFFCLPYGYKNKNM